MRTVPTVLGAALATLALGLPATPANAHGTEPTVEVVLTGLQNPRQLAADWHTGAVYVAEAGAGATDPTQCGEAGCQGRTGSITRIAVPEHTTGSATPDRVVRNLPSSAAPDGGFAVGVHGVDAIDGRLWAVVAGGAVELPATPPFPEAGKLLSYRAPGAAASVIADIERYELDNDPGGSGERHSNPYSVLALNDRLIVADAGANTVLEVKDGRVKVLAVLPGDGEGTEGQSVPAAVTRGPDGNYYVGELAEAAGPGGAKVYKIAPQGGVIGTIEGFTGVHGITFNRAGDLYVSELFGGDGGALPGQVVRIDHHTGERSTMAVPFPGGVAVDSRDQVYVAAWSISDSDGFTDPESGMEAEPGQIWRLKDF